MVLNGNRWVLDTEDGMTATVEPDVRHRCVATTINSDLTPAEARTLATTLRKAADAVDAAQPVRS